MAGFKTDPIVLMDQTGGFTTGDNFSTAVSVPSIRGVIYLSWTKGVPANTADISIQGQAATASAWSQLKTRGNAQQNIVSSAASTDGWFAPWDSGSGAAGAHLLPMRTVRVNVNLNTGNGDGDTRCIVEFHPFYD